MLLSVSAVSDRDWRGFPISSGVQGHPPQLQNASSSVLYVAALKTGTRTANDRQRMAYARARSRSKIWQTCCLCAAIRRNSAAIFPNHLRTARGTRIRNSGQRRRRNRAILVVCRADPVWLFASASIPGHESFQRRDLRVDLSVAAAPAALRLLPVR